tara:strand:+ start:917 stop:1234 length:318 start_codon:yes stop_codon:yes gene_type:complete
MKRSYINETKFEQDFCKCMKESGWQALKLEGPRGWPDRTLLSPEGDIYFIEFKNPNGLGVLSPAQSYWMKKLEDMRFKCYVINDIKQAESILSYLTGEDDGLETA